MWQKNYIFGHSSSQEQIAVNSSPFKSLKLMSLEGAPPSQPGMERGQQRSQGFWLAVYCLTPPLPPSLPPPNTNSEEIKCSMCSFWQMFVTSSCCQVLIFKIDSDSAISCYQSYYLLQKIIGWSSKKNSVGALSSFLIDWIWKQITNHSRNLMPPSSWKWTAKMVWPKEAGMVAFGWSWLAQELVGTNCNI